MPRPRYHEPDALGALSDPQVACRTLGHSWEDYIPDKRPPRYVGGDRLSLLCVRCGTKRHDIVSWIDGTLLDRQYEYPDGYHLSEKLSRSDFRLALINRRRKHHPPDEIDLRERVMA